MRTRTSLLTVAAVAAGLAAPAAALAQSAGDEQYTDPFGQQEQPAEQPDTGGPEQPAGGGGSEQPAGGGDGSAEPAPDPAPTTEAAPSAEAAPSSEAAPSAKPAPSADPAQADAPTLPRTGLPAALLAATGYALLLAGFAIRRRA